MKTGGWLLLLMTMSMMLAASQADFYNALSLGHYLKRFFEEDVGHGILHAVHPHTHEGRNLKYQ